MKSASLLFLLSSKARQKGTRIMVTSVEKKDNELGITYLGKLPAFYGDMAGVLSIYVQIMHLVSTAQDNKGTRIPRFER